jgi:hypothetical protein
MPQKSPIVPQGWKLVPVEPTQEMVNAGDLVNWLANGSSKPQSVYHAMLAASPAPDAGDVELPEVSVTLDEVAALAKTMWKGEPLPGRVLRFGAAVLGLADAARTRGVPVAGKDHP